MCSPNLSIFYMYMYLCFKLLTIHTGCSYVYLCISGNEVGYSLLYLSFILLHLCTHSISFYALKKLKMVVYVRRTCNIFHVYIRIYLSDNMWKLLYHILVIYILTCILNMLSWLYAYINIIHNIHIVSYSETLMQSTAKISKKKRYIHE